MSRENPRAYASQKIGRKASKEGRISPMFLGEYGHTIDGKGRLTIPSKYRAVLAQGLVVSRGFAQNLSIYPLDAWHNLTEKVLSRPVSDQKMMSFRRRIFSGAADLTPDKQGRILIPTPLRQFAHLSDEVIIVGNFDFLEIWNRSAWETERNLIEESDSKAMWNDLGI